MLGLTFLIHNKLARQANTIKSNHILFVIGKYSLTLLT